MRIYSHLALELYPLHLPEVFQNICKPLVEKMAFDPYDTASTEKIQFSNFYSKVQYSLNEPLNHSFTLKAFHGDVVARATENSPAADSHYIVAPMQCLSAIFQGKKHLAIRTADCLAIVFVFENSDYFIGAVTHAGWRGLTSGIVQKTLKKLAAEAELVGISGNTFLSSVRVHIAPAIFGVSYECGEDVAQAMQQHKQSLKATYPQFEKYEQLYSLLINVQQDPLLAEVVNEQLLSNQQSIFIPGKIFPDLQLLAALECIVSGIQSQFIEILRENTYSHPTLFSFREASHKKTNSSHRQWTHLSFPPIGNNSM